jgi:hypothetical protein
MTLLDQPFEYRNWPVGKDFDRIREYNPLDAYPALRARAARYEALPVFQRFHVPFNPPKIGTAK